MGWETLYALYLNKSIEKFNNRLFFDQQYIVQDISYSKACNRKERCYGKGLQHHDSIYVDIKYGTDCIIDLAKKICNEYNVSVIISVICHGNCTEFDYNKLNGKIIHSS